VRGGRGAAAACLAACLAAYLSLWSAASQAAPSLRLLAPAAGEASTTREYVNVLGRTEPGMRVRVGGQEVPVYATGVFVRDRVPLQPGANVIAIEVVDPQASPQDATRLDLQVQRQTPAAAPPAPPSGLLAIDAASVLPRQERRVAPGEPFEVGFDGTPGMLAQARLPGGPWQALAEDAARPGRYRARLHLPDGPDTEPQPVQLRLRARPGARVQGARTLERRSEAGVGRWSAQALHLAAVGPEGAELVHGLHEVRLGGPNLAELQPGTLLRLTGQDGAHYRVRLAPDTHAWVAVRSVERRTDPALRLPAPVFTTVRVAGSEHGDVVSIPFPAPAAWTVRSTSTPDGRAVLEVDLYGTHLAATWVTQLASARVVREVTLEQPADERVRVRIVPHAPRLWGWRAQQTPSGLTLTLRASPAAGPGPSPLAGLTVALEAGHGGPTNLGAVGATGVPEKDINRWTTDALAAELQAVGARVVMVREGDENPNLRERARRVTASDAALFVSIHANAADTSGGYLRAAGTSTYFKHEGSRELSGLIQRRLLQDTGLPDFGHVGSFNYAPIRLVTWMPAVLVEQAFVSNPREEALLLDPAFRARLARAVRQGLEDYLERALRP